MISESLNCWRKPFTLTLFFDLDRSREKSKVIASIHEFEKQLKASTHPVKELIHFVRIFLLPNNDPINDQIVFSVVFDGGKIDFLNSLVDGLRKPLLDIIENTVGGSELNSHRSDVDLAKWLLLQNCNPAAYHVGTVWNSLEEINVDRKIVLEISAFLDERSDLHLQAPAEVKTRIEEMLEDRMPEIASNVRERASFKLLRYLDGLLFLLVVFLIPLIPSVLIVVTMGWSLIALGWLIPAVAITLLAMLAGFIGCLELFEKDEAQWPDDSRVRQIVSCENVSGQNQMTLIADVKDSRARRFVIAGVLWIADAISRHWYRRGTLAGIDTIHFARFFLLKGNTKMLFLSDYDGSWSRYLFDFTGAGSLAVVPIWYYLKGCPKAKFLRWPKIGFEERFLPFTRLCQIETPCWFSSYPRLTVCEIKRNEKVRAGLFKPSSDREALNWLALFSGGENE